MGPSRCAASACSQPPASTRGPLPSVVAGSGPRGPGASVLRADVACGIAGAAAETGSVMSVRAMVSTGVGVVAVGVVTAAAITAAASGRAVGGVTLGSAASATGASVGAGGGSGRLATQQSSSGGGASSSAGGCGTPSSADIGDASSRSSGFGAAPTTRVSVGVSIRHSAASTLCGLASRGAVPGRASPGGDGIAGSASVRSSSNSPASPGFASRSCVVAWSSAWAKAGPVSPSGGTLPGRAIAASGPAATGVARFSMRGGRSR